MTKFYTYLALLVFISLPVMADYPGDSIYHLNSVWLTQNSDSITLKDLAGKKVVMAMTYTSCQHTCPVIVSNMQAIEKRLPEEARDDVAFVLVSLMPDVDTPTVLESYSKKRGLENWKLLSGSANDVRTLAMVLDVKYEPAGENEISHSNLIIILDEKGSIERRLSGSSMQSEAAVESLLPQIK